MKMRTARGLAVAAAIVSGLASYLPQISDLQGYGLSLSAILIAVLLVIGDPVLLGRSFWLLRRTWVFWVFATVLLVTQLIVAASGGLGVWGLAKTAGYVLVLGVSYFVLANAACESFGTVWPAVCLALLPVSVMGVLGPLGVTSIGVLPWRIPVVGLAPSQSILEDQNFFALVTFIGIVTAIFAHRVRAFRQPSSVWLTVLGVHIAGFFFAYSRAAILAVGAGALIWVLTQQSLRWPSRIGILAIAGGVTGVVVPFALQHQSTRDYLQISLSLTGRELLWPLALQLISRSPYFGYGVGNIGGMLFARTGQWVSSHNVLLDFMLMTGLSGGLALSALIFVSIAGLIRRTDRQVERRFLLASLAGVLIISQFITFTPGGAGFGSLVFAVLLGQANCVAKIPAQN